MERFTGAIQKALDNKNWYAALALALTLPDICGRIDQPSAKSSVRYVAWTNKWLAPVYTRPVGAERVPHVFLSGKDCYALRCSYMHAGEDMITSQPIREALSSFHFTEPKDGFSVHLNQIDSALQLQVDLFCLDMLAAVGQWLSTQGHEFPDETANFLTVWEHPFG